MAALIDPISLRERSLIATLAHFAMSKQAQDVATSDEPSLEEVLAVLPPTEASKANK
jgi:hypothetical protein